MSNSPCFLQSQGMVCLPAGSETRRITWHRLLNISNSKTSLCIGTAKGLPWKHLFGNQQTRKWELFNMVQIAGHLRTALGSQKHYEIGESNIICSFNPFAQLIFVEQSLCSENLESKTFHGDRNKCSVLYCPMQYHPLHVLLSIPTQQAWLRNWNRHFQKQGN
jgi:hypothetical protein